MPAAPSVSPDVASPVLTPPGRPCATGATVSTPRAGALSAGDAAVVWPRAPQQEFLAEGVVVHAEEVVVWPRAPQQEFLAEGVVVHAEEVVVAAALAVDDHSGLRRQVASGSQTAFITRTGTKYHTSASCKGLRKATRVWEGSRAGLEPCAHCAGGNAGTSVTKMAGGAPTRPRSAMGMPPAAAAATQTAFITRTGKKWHTTASCKGLRKATRVWEGSRAGLEPCAHCAHM